MSGRGMKNNLKVLVQKTKKKYQFFVFFSRG